MCSNPSPWDIIVGIFSMLTDPIGTIIKIIAGLVLSAAVSIYAQMFDGVPSLVATGGNSPVSQISDQVRWLVTYIAIGSLIFAAIRMALERRGNAGFTAVKGFLRLLLVAGGATAVMTAAGSVSDNFADHLLTQSAKQVLESAPCTGGNSGIESFLLLALALMMLLAGIIQVIMLYLRLGVLTLLLGTLPLAAAASMTDWGGGWWRKHIGWLVAWLLYKPAVGLVIFAGASMLSDGRINGNVQMRIAGIGVLLLSALALPALLRLVVPAVGALGGSNAAGAAVSAAGGAVASGAKKLASGSADGGASTASASGSRDRGTSGSSGGSGASGRDGGRGPAGGNGRTGAGAGGGGRVPAGAGAAGPAGVALVAADVARRGASMAKQTVTGAIEGADGNAGHNN